MFAPWDRDRLQIDATVWLAMATLLFWSRFPAPVRRLLALFTSAAGLLFLILAMRTEGLREVSTLSAFLLGAPYVTQQASASASLPYYLLTGFCLLLGTTGLAVSDETVGVIRRRWLASAVAVSLVVTALRFCLEKVAAPATWTWAVGVGPLAPLVGALFAVNLRGERRSFKSLAGPLLLYAFAARGPVAALAVVTSVLRLGSHYDVSVAARIRFLGRIYEFVPGSWSQIWWIGVVPQFTFWPFYTLVMGLLGGVAAWILTSTAQSRDVSTLRPDLPIAAAGEER